MSSPDYAITEENLHLFYSIDRAIFTRLVITLMRDPAQALLIMALWQWLEKDYPNILHKMSRFSDALVAALADEAVLCLRCLDFSTCSPSLLRLEPNVDVVLTSRLTGKHVTYQMFMLNRYTIICGVKNYLTNVCARVFIDIIKRVLPFSSILSHVVNPRQPLVIPGFPHRVFGALNVMPEFVGGFTPTPGGMWGWSPEIESSIDDKTMFLTFSRGFHVTVEEVKELFSGVLDVERCVEDVDMENVGSNEQPLYAKMVLTSVKLVDKILKGNRVAKFRINGKHIWARKYERRD